MASDFNNDPLSSPHGDGSPVAPDGTGAEAKAETPPEAAPVSPAVARFNSCRWQEPAEDGRAAFCTHREVKPYAGATTFDPEAWCGDCQYYKLRRAPKKRTQSSDDWNY